MSRNAKAYITATATLGVLVLQHSPAAMRPSSAMRFVCYLAGVLLTSRLKVRLPGIKGTLSVNFFFLMMGILDLDARQVLMLATAGTMAQMWWRRGEKRPQAVQMVFNLACVTVASSAAYGAYHWPLLQAFNGSPPVALVVSTVLFFLLNTLAVSGVLVLTGRDRFWRMWRENFLWTAAQYMALAALAGLVHAVDERTGWDIALLLLPIIYLIYRSYDVHLSRLEEAKKHGREMADLHLRTIEALAMAIDAKDDSTYDHLRRVKVYATEIGKSMGLEAADLLALQAAALLHDIGKLAVPEYIISKPGRLTPEEFEKMKIHPVVGAEILERVQFPYPVVPMVRAHHEKWNGSGYPDGLKGEEIPMGARILSVVDCLDALASDRQYRRAFPLELALEKVFAESGTSFDPRVVAVLARRAKELEQLARVAAKAPQPRLSTGARVSRGGAPGAGFETTAQPAAMESAGDFLESIAAARQEFHMLADVLNELGSSLSVEETLSLLAARLKHMIPFDTIAFYVRQSDRLKAQFVAGEEFRLFAELEIPLGQGLSGWVAENRRPIINGSPCVEPGYLNDPEKCSRLRSALAVPLDGFTGVAGVLTLYHADVDAFTREHLRILQAISSKAGLAIENALKFRQVEDSSVTDELTGLPNARSLYVHLDGELARARRTGSQVVLLMLDLDGFKDVNDRFGHLAGNKVLQAVAEGLRRAVSGNDYVARMGGDEFVVIAAGARSDITAATSRRLEQATREVGQAIYQEDMLSVSIGEASYPEDAVDAEQLLAAADKRMYQAKQCRRAPVAQLV